MDITRAVIKRSKLPATVKTEFLLRRAIKPSRVYTKREFRGLRREVMPVVKACVAELNTFIDSGGMDEAEADYYKRKGPATVDMILNCVTCRLDEYMLEQDLIPPPPAVRRTCTGYFGPTCTTDQVAFKDWEE